MGDVCCWWTKAANEHLFIFLSSSRAVRYVLVGSRLIKPGNIDAGLSVKTASKVPLYAGADAGIEISSIII